MDFYSTTSASTLPRFQTTWIVIMFCYFPAEASTESANQENKPVGDWVYLTLCNLKFKSLDIYTKKNIKRIELLIPIFLPCRSLKDLVSRLHFAESFFLLRYLAIAPRPWEIINVMCLKLNQRAILSCYRKRFVLRTSSKRWNEVGEENFHNGFNCVLLLTRECWGPGSFAAKWHSVC